MFKGTLTFRYTPLSDKRGDDRKIEKTVPFAMCDSWNTPSMNDADCECFSSEGFMNSCCDHAENMWWPPRQDCDGCTPNMRTCGRKDAFCRAVEADVDRADSRLLEKLELL